MTRSHVFRRDQVGQLETKPPGGSSEVKGLSVVVQPKFIDSNKKFS